MKSTIFKQFAESALVASTALTDAIEPGQRDEINAALGLGASLALSLSFDAQGHSVIRLELVNGDRRSCLASVSGEVTTIQ